jgi:hypothetical protein
MVGDEHDEVISAPAGDRDAQRFVEPYWLRTQRNTLRAAAHNGCNGEQPPRRRPRFCPQWHHGEFIQLPYRDVGCRPGPAMRVLFSGASAIDYSSPTAPISPPSVQSPLAIRCESLSKC